MPDCTTCPSSKVEIGTWPVSLYYRRAHSTGLCRTWKASQYQCGYILHITGRCSYVSSTCSFPNRTISLSQSFCTYPVPRYKSPEPSIESTLSQSQNCYMATSLVAPRLHWSPYRPFSYSLNSSKTCLYFLGAVHLRMICVYLILLSTSISYVISRCLNTPTVRLRIVRITAGPWWLNVSIYGNFHLIFFCLDAVRLESLMTSIYASYPSSVLSRSSIS